MVQWCRLDRDGLNSSLFMLPQASVAVKVRVTNGRCWGKHVRDVGHCHNGDVTAVVLSSCPSR